MNNYNHTSYTATTTKTFFVAFLFIALSSCGKKENESLTNLSAFRADASQAQVLDYSSINSNTTLTDRANGVDYIVKNELQITSGNLTIKPGVTIQFEDGAGMVVNAGGSLTAIGEKGNEIYFISKSGKRGDWKGITILSNSASNIISYAKIEHGGNAANIYGQANLIIGNSTTTASAEVSYSLLTASAAVGIIIGKGSTVRAFTTNTVSTNTTYPISMHITDAGSLQAGNIYSNNGKEFIELTGSGDEVIQQPSVLHPLNEPFALTGNIISGNNITIQAGTIAYMNNGAQLVLDGKNGNGSLTALGTANQPIRIVGVYGANGAWNSLNFKSSSSPLNQLTYCQITGGGAAVSKDHGMLNFECTYGNINHIEVRNCTISNSASTGIYLQNHTQYNSDIETANTFSSNVGANVFYDLK